MRFAALLLPIHYAISVYAPQRAVVAHRLRLFAQCSLAIRFG
jgi:hypothetical protein